MHRLDEVILAAASITLASLILLILVIKFIIMISVNALPCQRVGLSLAFEILKNQIFEDSKPFQKDEVKIVQERCANMIFEYIEASISVLNGQNETSPRPYSGVERGGVCKSGIEGKDICKMKEMLRKLGE
ncbi:hypothetical protein P8452_74529 [Trifolium repens]|nr:hypothetical protein P8452_74529 [Trifolium repens]